MTALRFGLLGAARITPPALVVPAHDHDDVVLQAVAARSPSRADAFAREHGVAQVLPDYASLVTSADVDVVYNALPINGHAPWTMDALRAGKHVLCEKPLAMNVHEVQRMHDVARASGVRLIEALHYRYHPAYVTYLDWVRDPAMGALRELHAFFNASIADDGSEIRYRPSLGGGAMMDLGCYPVSWVLTTMGALGQFEPVDVQAQSTLTRSGVDLSMNGVLTFACGVRASVSTTMQPGTTRDSRIDAVFANGRIQFDYPIAPQEQGVLRREIGGETTVADIDPRSTYVHQLAAVCERVRGSPALPTEGAAMLVQQRTIDRLYAAAGLRQLRYVVDG